MIHRYKSQWNQLITTESNKITSYGSYFDSNCGNNCPINKRNKCREAGGTNLWQTSTRFAYENKVVTQIEVNT